MRKKGSQMRKTSQAKSASRDYKTGPREQILSAREKLAEDESITDPLAGRKSAEVVSADRQGNPYPNMPPSYRVSREQIDDVLEQISAREEIG
jgi:hypothetical protein